MNNNNNNATLIDPYGLDPMDILDIHQRQEEEGEELERLLIERETISEETSVDPGPPSLVGVSTEFKAIKDSEWSVGDNGTVLTTRGHTSAPYSSRSGQLRNNVVFSNGIQQHCWVSELVLNAFTGPAPTPQHRPVHRDGNFENCQLENLVWMKFKSVKDARPHPDNERFIKPGSIYAYF